jgi:hypothetical protein
LPPQLVFRAMKTRSQAGVVEKQNKASARFILMAMRGDEGAACGTPRPTSRLASCCRNSLNDLLFREACSSRAPSGFLRAGRSSVGAALFEPLQQRKRPACTAPPRLAGRSFNCRNPMPKLPFSAAPDERRIQQAENEGSRGRPTGPHAGSRPLRLSMQEGVRRPGFHSHLA